MIRRPPSGGSVHNPEQWTFTRSPASSTCRTPRCGSTRSTTTRGARLPMRRARSARRASRSGRRRERPRLRPGSKSKAYDEVRRYVISELDRRDRPGPRRAALRDRHVRRPSRPRGGAARSGAARVRRSAGPLREPDRQLARLGPARTPPRRVLHRARGRALARLRLPRARGRDVEQRLHGRRARRTRPRCRRRAQARADPLGEGARDRDAADRERGAARFDARR